MMPLPKICHICATIYLEMLSRNENAIRKCFEKVTQIELENALLHHVCDKCVLTMEEFISFKERCLQANERMKKIPTQSTYIGSRKLYPDKIISSDNIPVIGDTEDSHLEVNRVVFHESESNINIENTAENSETQTDINVQSFEDETVNAHSAPSITIDEDSPNDSNTTDGGTFVDSTLIELNQVEDKPLRTRKDKKDDIREITRSTGKKKLRDLVKKTNLLLEKKPTFKKSDIAVRVMLTEKQELEEFAKRKSFESYLKAKFKCSDCFIGYKSEKNFDHHMKMHDKSRGEWQCHICKLRYRYRSRLRDHQVSHKIVYKCLTCGAVTNTKLQAIRHEKQQHRGNMFECKQCPAKFKNYKVYRWHIRTAHPTAHACGCCGGYYESRLELEKHESNINSCRKSSQIVLECKMCDEQFVRVKAWYDHMLRHVRNKDQTPPTECQICGHKTATWNDWSYHIFYEHRKKNGKPKVTCVCDVCGKTFSGRSGLVDHIGNMHKDETAVDRALKSKIFEKVACEICEVKVLSCNMKRHMLTHTTEKRFACDVCGKRFIRALVRDEHVKHSHQTMDYSELEKSEEANRSESVQTTREPDTVVNVIRDKAVFIWQDECKVCRIVIRRGNMRKHMVTHLPGRPYRCGRRGRSFTQAGSRKEDAENKSKNNKSQAGEKSYACDICDKIYNNKSNLLRHKLIHSGIRKWVCDSCGKTFKESSSLKLHINTVHLKLPHPPRKPRKKK